MALKQTGSKLLIIVALGVAAYFLWKKFSNEIKGFFSKLGNKGNEIPSPPNPPTDK